MPKTDPWGMVTNEQLAFVKFMVEDRNFLFRTVNLIDQNMFSPNEMKDIVRTIKDLCLRNEDITYDNIKVRMKPRYEDGDESKEISWMIIEAMLEEMSGDDCLEGRNITKYKDLFIKKLVEYVY